MLFRLYSIKKRFSINTSNKIWEKPNCSIYIFYFAVSKEDNNSNTSQTTSS